MLVIGFGQTNLPLNLSSLTSGLPCSLLVTPDFAWRSLVNQMTIAIPNQAGLSGLQFHMQGVHALGTGLCTGWGGSGGCYLASVALTDGLQCTVGI